MCLNNMKTNYMKILYRYKILISIIFILNYLAFTSCNKSKDVSPADNNQLPTEGTFKSELNGESWEGKSSSGIIKGGKIFITTKRENGDEFSHRIKW